MNNDQILSVFWHYHTIVLYRMPTGWVPLSQCTFLPLLKVLIHLEIVLLKTDIENSIKTEMTVTESMKQWKECVKGAGLLPSGIHWWMRNNWGQASDWGPCCISLSASLLLVGWWKGRKNLYLLLQRFCSGRARRPMAESANPGSDRKSTVDDEVMLGIIAAAEADRSVDMLCQLSKASFPLCMQQLHSSLRLHHHLRHYGRLQYGLFLKGIGMSLEEALRFWKSEFTKIMDGDKVIMFYLTHIAVWPNVVALITSTMILYVYPS